MRTAPTGNQETGRRAFVLAVLILVQALAGVFFTVDVVADLAADGKLEDLHMVLEALAALALVAGVAFMMVELRRLYGRIDRMETSLRAAQGEMAVVIDSFFSDWHLTPSERDVAFLMLKGLGNDAIGGLRGTAAGTVRAQCTAIYAKAGVDGRAQFLSHFMEELLAVEPGT